MGAEGRLFSMDTPEGGDAGDAGRFGVNMGWMDVWNGAGPDAEDAR